MCAVYEKTHYYLSGYGSEVWVTLCRDVPIPTFSRVPSPWTNTPGDLSQAAPDVDTAAKPSLSTGMLPPGPSAPCNPLCTFQVGIKLLLMVQNMNSGSYQVLCT